MNYVPETIARMNSPTTLWHDEVLCELFNASEYSNWPEAKPRIDTDPLGVLWMECLSDSPDNDIARIESANAFFIQNSIGLIAVGVVTNTIDGMLEWKLEQKEW